MNLQDILLKRSLSEYNDSNKMSVLFGAHRRRTYAAGIYPKNKMHELREDRNVEHGNRCEKELPR